MIAQGTTREACWRRLPKNCVEVQGPSQISEWVKAGACLSHCFINRRQPSHHVDPQTTRNLIGKNCSEKIVECDHGSSSCHTRVAARRRQVANHTYIEIRPRAKVIGCGCGGWVSAQPHD